MIIIVILSLFPVLIWSFMEPLGSRFSNLNAVTTSIGQILGLVGMVMFSINLILAGRFKFLDKYFHGLDKVYANHSKIGAIAFSLILFHPIFLVVKYITFSTREAALFFVPFLNMPITWGIISLLIMIVLIAFTFYIKVKYHIWKMSHKFMVVAFFFAVFHVFFISSDVSRNDFLRYYILILALVGLAVSARQAFLNKFFIKKTKYKVKNINQISKDVVEVGMEPVDKKIIFTPGQFAFFSFLNNHVSPEYHPFSISSSVSDENLKITVKNLGDYTGTMSLLKSGDDVLIDGPYGDFSYKNTKNKNQIWIAGGIGITPFFSMAQSLEDGYNVDLYYSVVEKDGAVYEKNLNDISSKNKSFKFTLWDVSEKGRINSGLISSASHGIEEKEIFLCGPLGFMEGLKSQFISLGVDIKKIHYENFSF